jgi:CO/xanthine dehydrogenase Mo-binding subunit
MIMVGNVVGRPLSQVFGLEKVTGRALFTIDLKLPGLLYAAVKHSEVSHARIKKIDVDKAVKLPGVVVIITGTDVPQGKHGRGLLDTPIMARDVIRYVGEPVAAVAAIDYETALEAVELIDVEYEELPAVFDPEESLSEKPFVIIHPQLYSYKRLTSMGYSVTLDPSRPNVSAYQRIVTGDVEAAFKEADVIVEGHYSTEPVSHVQLEPTSIIAWQEPDGGITVITSGQTPFRIRRELSDCLCIPEHKIRVIVPRHVGGGFGNRGAPIYEPIVAALAMRTKGRPVKLTLTRMEELSTTTVRHGTKIYIRDALSKDGKIKGRWIRVIYDGGAYSVAGTVAVKNAVYAITSLYKIPNLHAEIYRVYTNKIQGGAFRGFGTPQICWAIESQMDEDAEKLGIDPVEFRLINMLREGEKSCIGEVIVNDTTEACLKLLLRKLRENPLPIMGGNWRVGRGIAVAKKQCTFTYPSVAIVKVSEDASVDLFIGATDVGQGILTALAQIVAEEFGIELSKIRIVSSDTLLTPISPGSSGSRQLVQTGLAVVQACRDAKSKILNIAAEKVGIPVSRLSLRNGIIYSIDGQELLSLRDLFVHGAMGGSIALDEGVIIGKGYFYYENGEVDPTTDSAAKPQVALDYTPVCVAADVAVDIETGEVKVLRLFIAADVGRAINPALVHGQLVGAAAMGVSITLLESTVVDHGRVINPTLMDYLVAGALEIPEIDVEILESGLGPGPYGARAVGEAAILPVSPAIANAIKNAIGIRIRELPITPEKIFKKLHQHLKQ